MSRLVFPSLLIAALLVGAGPASAQEAAAEPPPQQERSTPEEAARHDFVAGMEAYEAGDFERALTLFLRSNEVVNSSELVFNIARAAEQIGQHQLALDHYILFLELEPEVENRTWVERRVAFLETQLVPEPEEPGEPEEPVVVAPPQEDPPPPVHLARDDSGPWALGISGAGLALAGAALLTWGLVERAQIEGLTTPTPWPELRDRVERSPIVSTVGGMSLGVGVALVATALVWVMSAGTPGEVALRIDSSGVGAAF